jgi:hypothetical protein
MGVPGKVACLQAPLKENLPVDDWRVLFLPIYSRTPKCPRTGRRTGERRYRLNLTRSRSGFAWGTGLNYGHMGKIETGQR